MVLSLARLLQGQIARSPELRQAARNFALWLASISTEPPESAPATDTAAPPEAVIGSGGSPTASLLNPLPAPAVPVDSQALVVTSEPPIDIAAAVRLLQAGLGNGTERAVPTDQRAGLVQSPPSEPLPDLELIARRCELKAEACDFARERNERLTQGADFEEVKARYEELLAKADTMQPCYLWMARRDTQDLEGVVPDYGGGR